jgi:hypothetical protein
LRRMTEAEGSTTRSEPAAMREACRTLSSAFCHGLAHHPIPAQDPGDPAEPQKADEDHRQDEMPGEGHNKAHDDDDANGGKEDKYFLIHSALHVNPPGL